MKNNIEIFMGEKTCAETPGNFCPFVKIGSFGSKYYCGLFNNEKIFDKDGWLMRTKTCLEKFKTGVYKI